LFCILVLAAAVSWQARLTGNSSISNGCTVVHKILLEDTFFIEILCHYHDCDIFCPSRDFGTAHASGDPSRFQLVVRLFIIAHFVSRVIVQPFSPG
jgi:hypothetical protein